VAGIIILLANMVAPTWAADNVIVQWNTAALQAIRDTHPGPPIVARMLSIAHTCMYDAWTPYDAVAVGTRLGQRLRQPVAERSESNKQKAVSFAAYRALVDLFPTEQSKFDSVMTSLGYAPTDASTDTQTPAGVENAACQAVLDFRHHDGSNQLGNLHVGAYTDYTGYTPVNSSSQ